MRLVHLRFQATDYKMPRRRTTRRKKRREDEEGEEEAAETDAEAAAIQDEGNGEKER